MLRDSNILQADNTLGHFYFSVRTRKEVASLPPDELKPFLLGWMVHSPTEIIPSRGQIALVEEILLGRVDIRNCGHAAMKQEADQSKVAQLLKTLELRYGNSAKSSE